MHENILDRFWSKVNKEDSGGCWNFLGYKDKDGYGIFALSKHDGTWTNIRAHRLVWEAHYDQNVPKGMYILHMCDNPSCCNPMHLYCGTQFDNMKDMVDRDRMSKNPRPYRSTGKARFFEREILMIRKLKGHVLQQKAADMFEVSRPTISHIWNDSKYPCKEGYLV